MKFSPMMENYITLKEKYKDCIIFYRLGDFYEMFFEDAERASKMLDLTLTGRDCGSGQRAPMCGVPYHAADIYISKLVSFGEKVAICEQVAGTSENGVMNREIVRIVTAGTITNNELIDDKNNNFLLSVYLGKEDCAISWVDITTGEFFTKNYVGDIYNSLFNDLVKINPAEIIGNEQAVNLLNDSPLVKQGIVPKVSYFIESEFNLESAKRTLEKHFKVASLSVFNLEDDNSIRSSGALISYLIETQKNTLVNINEIKVESDAETLMMDLNTVRNLELIKTIRDGKRYGSLLWLLDKTKTSMGARKLQKWILSPLNTIEGISYRLNGVEAFFSNTLIRHSLTALLSEVRDIGRITGKIANGNVMPKDCVSLKYSLEALPNIKFQLSGIGSDAIVDIYSSIIDFSELTKLLSDAISDDEVFDKNNPKYIKSGFNKELDDLRHLFKNGRSAISALEAKEREKTGIKNLKISYNRVFGYYIEVTNSFKDKIPYDYVRRQTLANAERFITEELKVLEEEILTAEDKAFRLELELYERIKNVLRQNVEKLQKVSDAIATLDVLLSLATVARDENYVKPNILKSGSILKITDGRHPVVQKTSKQRFVPNDTLLDCDENKTMIITGPNMAGKSTYMRQVALITLMAHIGSFVPATKADIPITDKIFTRIGASDSLINDRSTYMVEMSETADIINNATKDSIVILDEIGRGTSTFDGLSIAWAVVEYINEKIGAKTLFATHYHELTELEGVLSGVKNYKVTVRESLGEIVFLRKIMRGGANKSFGIEVATLAGVKKEVTDRAKTLLKKIESSDTHKIKLNLSENEVLEQKILPEFSEVERIVLDIDLNNTSPMQAFNILSDLQEKLRGKDE